jgi:hypothetical protein
MIKIETALTPRLAACLEAGGADALHPILSTWSQAELVALELDMQAAYNQAVAYMDAEFRRAVRMHRFLPEHEALYRAKRRGLLEVFMEIYEVLHFYLNHKEHRETTQ